MESENPEIKTVSTPVSESNVSSEENIARISQLCMIVDARIFRAWLARINAVTDEVRVIIDPIQGITVKAVDPAHVAMIEAWLPAPSCQKFSGMGEVGIDTEKLLDAIKGIKGNVIVSLLEGKENYHMELSSDSMTRIVSLVDTAGMTDPKVPNLPGMVATFDMSANDLLAAIKECGKVSDHMQLTVDYCTVLIDAKGDTDKVHISLAVTDLIGPKSPVMSDFPLDYLGNLLRPLKGETLGIQVGQDYPIGIDWSSGHYLLAPRIESD